MHIIGNVKMAHLKGLKYKFPRVYELSKVDNNMAIVKKTNIPDDKGIRNLRYYRDLFNPNNIYTHWHHAEKKLPENTSNGESVIVGLDPVWVYSPKYSPKRKKIFIFDSELREVYDFMSSPDYNQDEIDERIKEYYARKRKR